MVEYRRDEATGEGEGWPRARSDHFTFAADNGPWSLDVDERDVADVAVWAASPKKPSGRFPDVVLSVAANGDTDTATLAYLDSDAARALAAQLLAAADAAEGGRRFDPTLHRADEAHR